MDNQRHRHVLTLESNFFKIISGNVCTLIYDPDFNVYEVTEDAPRGPTQVRKDRVPILIIQPDHKQNPALIESTLRCIGPDGSAPKPTAHHEPDGPAVTGTYHHAN